MIKKIVSGGQTGADRAALDAAVKLDIPHGGWIPKGRMAEDGPISEKYQLEEMPTANYPDRTEQNVIDSDGTLILSHGKLTGGSAYTRDMALEHERPWLHTDLNKTSKFDAARKISTWIVENGIEILNVAGPRASKDPRIYDDVLEVLEAVYALTLGADKPLHLSEMPVSGKTIRRRENTFPKTVDEAVNRLLPLMSLRDKSTVAHLEADKLPFLKAALGNHIKNRLAVWCTTPELVKSCMHRAGKHTLHGEEAFMVILHELWKVLKKTHTLRVVK
jgi:hypothetical protein